MQTIDFDEAIERILKRDSRYSAEAYYLVREILKYTHHKLGRGKKHDQHHHISSQEFLEGTRLFSLKEFGPMAFYVLKTWGIHTCEDIGELISNMIEAKLLSKKEDEKDDFKDGFEFVETFVFPFLPPSKLIQKKIRSKIRKYEV